MCTNHSSYIYIRHNGRLLAAAAGDTVSRDAQKHRSITSIPHGLSTDTLLQNSTLVATVVLTSVIVYGKFIPFYYIAFVPNFIYKKGQVWRLATSFWLTGPKLSMLMDPVFRTSPDIHKNEARTRKLKIHQYTSTVMLSRLNHPDSPAKAISSSTSFSSRPSFWFVHSLTRHTQAPSLPAPSYFFPCSTSSTTTLCTTHLVSARPAIL